MSRTRSIRTTAFGASVGLAALAAATLTGPGAAQAADPGEGSIRHADAAGAIDGSYIVVLDGQPSNTESQRHTVATKADQLVDRYGGEVDRVYSAALRGFAVQANEQRARRLAADPDVRYVAQNGMAHATETWGLDRIDQTDLPLDDSYTPPNDGSGATAYIVDSGMDLGHADYGGRATSGPDYIDGDDDASDCDGHGTHVGGTVGSETWGVAKNVDLVAVRVLDCAGSGPWDGVLSGVDWVTRNAPEAAVGNMSLGGAQYDPLDEAVENSSEAGVAWAVAAGNSGEDACNSSPAAAPSALTVAASDSDDARSIWFSGSSNYGDCVDLFAPGSNITSTTMGGGSGEMGGTSMASPHGAGALALEFSANPDKSVDDAIARVADTASQGKISDVRGSPNLLLNVTDLGGGTSR